MTDLTNERGDKPQAARPGYPTLSEGAPLLAGTLGGLLATCVTFAPCFAWIFLGAPWMEKLRKNTALASALSAVTAAVVGVILNLAIWFAIHVVWQEVVRIEAGPLSMELPVPGSVDWAAAALAVLALVAVFRLKPGMATALGARRSRGSFSTWQGWSGKAMDSLGAAARPDRVH